MKEQLTAVFQQVPEGYTGFVEELPGANAQGASLEEARSNLREAVRLVLEASRTLAEEDLRDKSMIREPFAQISWSGSTWSAIWEKHGAQFLREGGNHSVYVNRKTGKASTVPRHREINEFLAQKICRDLEIPKP